LKILEARGIGAPDNFRFPTHGGIAAATPPGAIGARLFFAASGRFRKPTSQLP
jgi:hypothetical protein